MLYRQNPQEFHIYCKRTFIAGQRCGEIVPEVQATPEHPHLFDALLHVAEHTGFRKTYARNHLKRSHRNTTGKRYTFDNPSTARFLLVLQYIFTLFTS